MPLRSAASRIGSRPAKPITAASADAAAGPETSRTASANRLAKTSPRAAIAQPIASSMRWRARRLTSAGTVSRRSPWAKSANRRASAGAASGEAGAFMRRVGNELNGQILAAAGRAVNSACPPAPPAVGAARLFWSERPIMGLTRHSRRRIMSGHFEDLRDADAQPPAPLHAVRLRREGRALRRRRWPPAPTSSASTSRTPSIPSARARRAARCSAG